MPTIILVLLAAALALFWLSRRQRKASGLPGGRIVYSDTYSWGPVEEPLYDPRLGLVGKPDYLIEQGEELIPVEVKSGRAPEGPYDTHIFQLASYCLLVERVYGRRPAYGLLHYSPASGAGHTFAIDYTQDLEAALLDLLDEIRQQERRKEVHRSHEAAARCRGCGFRSTCDERL
jgi:CRISPR-associated exonuclease Cas4